MALRIPLARVLAKPNGVISSGTRAASSALEKVEVFVDDKKVLVDPGTTVLQEWEDSDRRLARFTDKPKQINEKFAINLIAEVPPKIVKERIVSCNGGGGALGHPKVFINLDKPGPKACGYCGLRFVKEEDHHH
ncbi:hypothetical protein QYM36_003182 [Artemia franciscana]|uniref:Zinc finger CHCC-type domain-containing protein n=1 Tax=Artemia franciscana TaxID=6661 RepID=A0AA88I6R6_ARTSF|nr:hypothetical protein QYM36_003182 [Artemia franciscana]